jgi:hypothetical protein
MAVMEKTATKLTLYFITFCEIMYTEYYAVVRLNSPAIHNRNLIKMACYVTMNHLTHTAENTSLWWHYLYVPVKFSYHAVFA